MTSKLLMELTNLYQNLTTSCKVGASVLDQKKIYTRFTDINDKEVPVIDLIEKTDVPGLVGRIFGECFTGYIYDLNKQISRISTFIKTEAQGLRRIKAISTANSVQKETALRTAVLFHSVLKIAVYYETKNNSPINIKYAKQDLKEIRSVINDLIIQISKEYYNDEPPYIVACKLELYSLARYCIFQHMEITRSNTTKPASEIPTGLDEYIHGIVADAWDNAKVTNNKKAYQFVLEILLAYPNFDPQLLKEKHAISLVELTKQAITNAVNPNFSKVAEILIETCYEELKICKNLPHLALQYGHTTLALKALKLGFDPSYRDEQGNNVLHYACANRNIEVTKKLLKSPLQFLCKNKKKESPIQMLFSAKGRFASSISTKDFLLEYFAGFPLFRKCIKFSVKPGEDFLNYSHFHDFINHDVSVAEVEKDCDRANPFVFALMSDNSEFLQRYIKTTKMSIGSFDYYLNELNGKYANKERILRQYNDCVERKVHEKHLEDVENFIKLHAFNVKKNYFENYVPLGLVLFPKEGEFTDKKLRESYVNQYIQQKLDTIRTIFHEIYPKNDTAANKQNSSTSRKTKNSTTPADITPENPEVMLKNLNDFLEKIEHRKAYLGTPSETDSEALKKFYDDIRRALALTVAYIEDLPNDSVEKGQNKAVLINELIRASKNCGGRMMQVSIEVYYKICRKKGIDYPEIIQDELSELRTTLLTDIIANMFSMYHSNVHKFNGIMSIFGKKYKLKGSAQFENFNDPFFSCLSDNERIVQRLNELSNSSLFFDWFKDGILTRESLRTAFVSWYKKNVPDEWKANEYKDKKLAIEVEQTRIIKQMIADKNAFSKDRTKAHIRILSKDAQKTLLKAVKVQEIDLENVTPDLLDKSIEADIYKKLENYALSTQNVCWQPHQMSLDEAIKENRIDDFITEHVYDADSSVESALYYDALLASLVKTGIFELFLEEKNEEKTHKKEMAGWLTSLIKTYTV